MPTLAKTATILSISILTAGAALADSGHYDGDASEPRMHGHVMPMGGDRHDMMAGMMRMMMQMHDPDAMSPGMGPMGGMSMMDIDMMQMMGMMEPDMMNGMPRGGPGQMMQSRLGEYDADGDGTLSLDEFADWHAAMLRETMVDRFQHLDADGDGAITSEEMGAFAGRLNRMRDDDADERPMMRGMPDRN